MGLFVLDFKVVYLIGPIAQKIGINLRLQNIFVVFYPNKFFIQFDHFKVELVNLALHLVEDRPPANATSPGSLPVDVAIPSLTIVREKSGLFSIQPTGGWLSYFQRIGQFI